MTITLPEDVEAWARQEVASGRATSVEEAVAQAVRENQQLFAGHAALVAHAYEQVARGEVFSENEVNAEFDRWAAEDSQ